MCGKIRLKAALLHDTVEDTDTSIEEIKEEFGEKIAGTCCMWMNRYSQGYGPGRL